MSRNFASAALALMVLGCTPVAEPGSRAHGTFVFRAANENNAALLDGLSVASAGGRVYFGTARDLRLVRGSKSDGFGEPEVIEVTPGFPAEVHALVFSADGGFLFIGYADGVAMIDTAKAELQVGAVSRSEPVARIFLEGTTLVTVSFTNVVRTFSVADPYDIVPLGKVTLPGGDGTVRGGTVSGAKGTFTAPGALWVVDFADLASPAVISTLEVPLIGSGVRKGNHVFTGNVGALSVLDLSNEQQAKPVGGENTPWRMPGAAPVVHGDRLFIVDGEWGDVYIADVSEPTEPTLETWLRPGGEVPCGGAVRDATFDADQVLWVACTGGGVAYVIDY
jgi:hypothetical protein